MRCPELCVAIGGSADDQFKVRKQSGSPVLCELQSCFFDSNLKGREKIISPQLYEPHSFLPVALYNCATVSMAGQPSLSCVEGSFSRIRSAQARHEIQYTE
jgi:hypothetical protein